MKLKKLITKFALIGCLTLAVMLPVCMDVSAKELAVKETAFEANTNVCKSSITFNMLGGNISFESETNISVGTMPTPEDNLITGLKKKSYLVATETGYMRVFYDGEKVCLEYYDDNFGLLSKKQIAMELEYWGGFYAATDAYYLIEGQPNLEQSFTKEVIRVIKYDLNWNKKGTAKLTGDEKLFGGEIRYPFDYGCVEMTEKDGNLYLVTGHEGYVDAEYGQGHQGFLMYEIDKKTMTGKLVDCDYWHSFAQYIDTDGKNLYVLEQSEGSRMTKLTKYDGTVDEWWGNYSAEIATLLKYGGDRTSAWAIACYASVDDMAISDNNILCIGTSIDQTNYDEITSDTPHNIYLTTTPLANYSTEATSLKWITNFKDGGASFYGVKLTKVNDNRFMISWEEYDKSQGIDTDDMLSTSILHYVFIDGNGKKISKEFTAAAPISDCKPIVKGNNIVYYASNHNMVDFYTINSTTGEFKKKVYRVCGENATWKYEKGTLTVFGTGEMHEMKERKYRYPISSTTRGYTYYDNGEWSGIKDSTTKIVVKKGITGVSENAFRGFKNVSEIILEDGIKSIGKEAFYGCESVKKVAIPASVKKIGEDILWTGSFWIWDDAHVMCGCIYAPYGSYAIDYAKKNGVSYCLDLSKAKITGVKASYAYNGKTQQPVVTVTLGKEKLSPWEYTVTYKNNKKVGKATITITGQGHYYGTVKKTFVITPKRMAISRITSPKKKTVLVKWKKDSQVTGYQLQYAYDKKFTTKKKTITITGDKNVSKKITKLKSRQKYYFRMRSYKLLNGKKVYGEWSKVKTVKCK